MCGTSSAPPHRSAQDKLSLLHIGEPQPGSHLEAGAAAASGGACDLPSSPGCSGRLHLALALLGRTPLMGPVAHLAIARSLLPWALKTVAVEMYDGVRVPCQMGRRCSRVQAP